VEVPNKRANTVMLKELLESEEFQAHKSTLAFTLGKNIAGEPVVCDLAQMPHLLIAGATGSGKSVCLNTIIASFLYRNKPDRVRFVMIDPKRVELSIYQAIPHLIAPVVTDTRKAAAALGWCVEQMEERYKRLADVGVRNIDGYNALAMGTEPSHKTLGNPLQYMPHIVMIIDELADLMMVAKNEVEEYVIRLAQMARAVGMHLIIATQRPSVNVITGIIKANFPSRIAFQVSSKVDSRTILDLNGAEALMGRGDMLYSPGGVKPFRLQGAFVSDAEVERLADAIRGQERARYEKEDFEVKPTAADRAKAQRGLGEEDYEDGWEDGDGADGAEEGDAEAGNGARGAMNGLAMRGRAADAPLKPCDVEAMSDEELYEMALRLVLESRKASVSYIQRRMKIGYARAGRLMDMMEENGIVGPYQGSKPRDLLVDPGKYLGGGD
jgi:S-DNA-T family DNA segregation ATPase FtsK/SpoIIIE